MAAYPAAKAAYENAVVAAKAAGQPLPKAPQEQADPATYKNRPSRLYNGMIHPLLPVAIRAILWYQGEGNKLRPRQYQTLLPTMIADWRQQWSRETCRFISCRSLPSAG